MTKFKLITAVAALTFSTGAFAAVANCCADMSCCKDGADCCDHEKKAQAGADCCDHSDNAKGGEHAGHAAPETK